MQICSVCSTESPDEALACSNCQADLRELSETAVALKKIQDNPRAFLVRIHRMDNACPACMEAQGAYPKDQVPHLPIEGCSHPNGCRCFYAPALSEIFP